MKYLLKVFLISAFLVMLNISAIAMDVTIDIDEINNKIIISGSVANESNDNSPIAVWITDQNDNIVVVDEYMGPTENGIREFLFDNYTIPTYDKLTKYSIKIYACGEVETFSAEHISSNAVVNFVKNLNNYTDDELFSRIVKHKAVLGIETGENSLFAMLKDDSCKKMFVQKLKNKDLNEFNNPAEFKKIVDDTLLSLYIEKYRWSEIKEIIVNKSDILSQIDTVKYNNLSSVEKDTLYKSITGGITNSGQDIIDLINRHVSNIIASRHNVLSGSFGGSVGSGGGGVGNGNASSGMNNIDVSIGNSFSVKDFNDIDTVLWAKDDIRKLQNLKVINGDLNNNFNPDNPITRAELIKIVISAFFTVDNSKDSMFEDVDKNHWASKYIATAQSMGIVKGDGKNFRPDDFITREDAACILHRAIGLKNIKFEVKTNKWDFLDVEQIGEYAIDSVKNLCSVNIINGYDDNTFMPKKHITRAETAVLIAKII